MGRAGFQAAKLVDQGLVVHPREECTDDVCVDDIREGVASLGKPSDVIPQGLVGLLLIALEVLGVSRADVRPLEIFYEDPLEVRPVADAVVWKEFKPCLNMFPHANGKVLNDEIVIIHASGPTGEPEIFKPNAWVGLPGVFRDGGGRPEPLRERCSPDALAEGPWPRALRAGAPVVRPATAPGARFTASLDGLAGICVACCRMADVVAVLGPMPVADDATSVLLWSVWSRRSVGPCHGCRTPSQA